MLKTATYYFWKWADNDTPGKPTEVHAALLRGKLHPALQPFDARPLLRCLQDAAAQGRSAGEEWNWQVHPVASPDKARFLFVTCPQINASETAVRRFHDRFVSLAVSGFDEQEGHLIPCLRPKLNCFITGQFPRETAHDITPDDLPFLLRRIRPGHPEPWGELWNRNNDAVVAVAQGRRFRVEWRNVFEEIIPGRFDQWRAYDHKRPSCSGGRDGTKSLLPGVDPEFLTYADTLRIFQAFLRGGARPPQYCWRKLKKSELT